MTIAQQLNITTFPFEIKDDNGNIIYVEFINGGWYKFEYDQNGNEIYCEDNYGIIRDNRPKREPEVKQETLDEAAAKYVETKWEPAQEENRESFIEGAKSDAARDYWFDQFKKNGGDK
jgi:hypothetical protein